MNYRIKTIITFLLLLTFGFSYGSDLDFKGTIEFTSQKDSQYTFELKDNSEISLIQNGENIYTYELEYVEKTENQGYPVYMYYVTNDKEGYQELMIFDLQDLTVNERREKLDQTGPVGLAFIIDLDESDYNYINVEVTKGKLTSSYFDDQSSKEEENVKNSILEKTVKKNKASNKVVFSSIKDENQVFTIENNEKLIWLSDGEEIAVNVTFKGKETLEGVTMYLYTTDIPEYKELSIFDLRKLTKKERNAVLSTKSPIVIFFSNPDDEDDDIIIEANFTSGEFSE